MTEICQQTIQRKHLQNCIKFLLLAMFLCTLHVHLMLTLVQCQTHLTPLKLKQRSRLLSWEQHAEQPGKFSMWPEIVSRWEYFFATFIWCISIFPSSFHPSAQAVQKDWSIILNCQKGINFSVEHWHNMYTIKWVLVGNVYFKTLRSCVILKSLQSLNCRILIELTYTLEFHRWIMSSWRLKRVTCNDAHYNLVHYI